MPTKTLVIGLDGTSWDLIMPWINQGRLPNLQRLIKNGVHGRLKSCLPPVTCPAWKCYSTGKSPANLGVFWWTSVNWQSKTMPTMHRSSSFKTPELWDYLNNGGLTTGIINMPTTYPPKKVDGFMVSGWESPQQSQFTYPPDLKNTITEKYNYKTRTQPLLYQDKHQTARHIIELMETRFNLAQDTLKNGTVDFLHLTLFYINTLHHFYWDDDVVLQAWTYLDKKIGEIINDNINTIIISDHGSMKITTSFYINSWLQEKGYLQVRNGPSKFLGTLGINQELLKTIATKMGLINMRKFLPRKAKNLIPQKGNTISGRDFEGLIDWDHSIVIGTGQGPIYLDKTKLNDRYPAFRQNLIDELIQLKDPSTNKPMFKTIWTKEQIYRGKYYDSAPDLFLETNKHIYIAGGIKHSGVFDYQNANWKAENDYYGILLAHGPAFKKGKTIENAQIIDVTPTILYMHNMEIPADLDGQPLTDMLVNDTYCPTSTKKTTTVIKHDDNTLQYEPPGEHEESEDVKDRLKALGYLG